MRGRLSRVQNVVRLRWSSKYARRGGAIGLGVLLLVTAYPAAAEDRQPTQEVWAGAEVTASNWSAYSGITAALSGPIDADGWRIRAVGGYGAYSYDRYDATIRGTIGFGDLLIGYQHQLGSLTLKGFIGASSESHNLMPLDPDNSIIGASYGAKAALETWWEMTPQAWSSLDLSWSTVHGGAYAARARTGYRIRPELSLGLEAAGSGNAEYDGGRGGVFLRYTWSAGEISASAGASVDRSGESGGYGTLNALYRY